MEVEENNLKNDNDEETKFQNEKSNNDKLDAKHCCFLCLKIIDSFTIQPISLKCLCRCLQINIEELFRNNSNPNPASSSSSSSPPFTGSNKELEANLCESCEKILIKFSQTFLTLEKYQMEVQYWLEKVHQQIFEGLCKPDRLENYSKMMVAGDGDQTDDDPFELQIMDDLRKEIATRSLEKKMTGGELTLKLFRLKLKPHLQTETFESLQKSPRNSRFSPPPSQEQPFSEDDEEDFQFTPTKAAPRGSHYVFNSETKKYHCRMCDKLSLTKSGAFQHYRFIHTKERFKCGICKSAAFPFQCHLTNHMKICRDLLQKRRMGRKLQAQRGLKYILNSETRKYHCKGDGCQRSFKTRSQAWYHYLQVHQKNEEECLTKSEIKIEIPADVDVDDPPKFQVAPKFSKYYFNSKTKTYHCYGCEREFINRSHAWNHYQSAHMRKRFKCDMPACHLTFPQQCLLIKHQRTCSTNTSKRLERITNPEYKFSCPTCGKRFIQLVQMEKHEKLVHLNVRNYPCDICNKKFKTSSHLTDHKNTVHFRKKFPCKICKRIYRTRTGRLTHERECSRNIKIEVLIRKKKPTSASVGNPNVSLSSSPIAGAASTSGSQCQSKNDDSGSAVKEIATELNAETQNNEEDATTGNKIESLSTKVSSFAHSHSPLSPETEDESSQHSNQSPSSPPALKLLMYSTHNPQTGKYKCNFHSCKKEFGTRSGVRNHYHFIHLNKPKPDAKVQCEMCLCYFRSPSHMYRHQKAVHFNLRNYKCELCGMGFNRKHHLKDHLARKRSCIKT